MLSSLIVIEFEPLAKVTDVTISVPLVLSDLTVAVTSFVSSHSVKLVVALGVVVFASLANEFIILATSYQVFSVVLAIAPSVVVAASDVALAKLLNLIALKLVILPNGNEVVSYIKLLLSVEITPTNPRLDQLPDEAP